jgi:excisionase family DNA binding protein
MADEALLYDEKAALQQLGGLGRTTFYELIRTGELASVKIGRRRFVPREALEGYVARFRTEQNGPSAA